MVNISVGGYEVWIERLLSISMGIYILVEGELGKDSGSGSYLIFKIHRLAPTPLHSANVKF